MRQQELIFLFSDVIRVFLSVITLMLVRTFVHSYYHATLRPRISFAGVPNSTLIRLVEFFEKERWCHPGGWGEIGEMP